MDAMPADLSLKREKTRGANSKLKLRRFAPRPLGANGRPIVLSNVKYSVDLAALKEYAASDEAARTRTGKNGMTEREVLERFLNHVVPTGNGSGLCTVSYTGSEIGHALIQAGLLPPFRSLCREAHCGGKPVRMEVASNEIYLSPGVMSEHTLAGHEHTA